MKVGTGKAGENECENVLWSAMVSDPVSPLLVLLMDNTEGQCILFIR